MFGYAAVALTRCVCGPGNGAEGLARASEALPDPLQSEIAHETERSLGGGREPETLVRVSCISTVPAGSETLVTRSICRTPLPV